MECKLCRKDLPDSRERRKLSSPQTCIVVQACRTLSLSHDLPFDESYFQEGYVCKKCFLMVERHTKLLLKLEQSAKPIIECLRGISVGVPSTNRPNRKRKKRGSHSPEVMISVEYPTFKKKYSITTPSRRKLAKAIGRNRRATFTRQTVVDRRNRAQVVRSVKAIIANEINAICSKSTLVNTKKDDLISFNFENCKTDLNSKAPVLYELIHSCVPSTSQLNGEVITCVCIAILCKSRRPCVSLLQRLCSLSLYSGHCSKQVFNQFQKLGLSLSHSGTIKLLDGMGKHHDQSILEKRDSVQSHMSVGDGAHSTILSSAAISAISPMSLTAPVNPVFAEVEVAPSTPLPSCYNGPGVGNGAPSTVIGSSTYTPLLGHDTSSEEFDLPLHSSPFTSYLPDPVFFEDSPSSSYYMGLESSGHSTSDPQSFSQSAYPSYSDQELSDIGMEAIFGDSPLSTSPELTSSQMSAMQHETPISTFTASSGSKTTNVPQNNQSDSSINTFSLVFDNLDKYVKSFDMRMNHQSKSVHFVNSIAVVDRIDIGHLPCTLTSSNQELDMKLLLPSAQDFEVLKKNFVIHVSRLLVEYMPCFSKNSVTKHIPHKYSKQMSLKSVVVSLGILLKNENKTDEMVDILETLHKYVPTTSSEVIYQHPDSGEDEKLRIDHFRHILVGGDQLTVARVRSAHMVRKNSNTSKDRLEGLVPSIQDWHAKLCLLQIVFGRLYKAESGAAAGTLYQLRNLINRRNVVKDPSKDFKACEDYFLLVVTAHILCACLQVNEMEGLDSTSTTAEGEPKSMEAAAMEIISQFTDIRYPVEKETVKGEDRVLEYAREVITLGLFYLEFQDSIREGDGIRVLRCWKFILLFCRATGHHNYANEALNLLIQYHYIFPPCLAVQLLQSRFVNTSGFPGHNIAADLHLEHLNRLCKDSIKNLGANKSGKAFERIGRSSQALYDILHNFNDTLNVAHESSSHTRRTHTEDLEKIMHMLKECQVLQRTEKGRHHTGFGDLACNLFKKINKGAFEDWIAHRFRKSIATNGSLFGYSVTQ